MRTCVRVGISILPPREGSPASHREEADDRRAGRSPRPSQVGDLLLGPRPADPRLRLRGRLAGERAPQGESCDAGEVSAAARGGVPGGRRTFPGLATEPTFRDFVCLYLAEGSKRRRNVVAICNSDPAVIKIAQRWIGRFTRGRLSYSLQHHADQDLLELTAFWAQRLGTEPAAIRLQRKSNSNGLTGRSWRSRYGVLTVSSNDTAFRMQLEGWMDCLRESWV